MTKVETLKPHSNAYGDKYEKAEGDKYELPEEQAAGLVGQRLVKRLDAAKPADK